MSRGDGALERQLRTARETVAAAQRELDQALDHLSEVDRAEKRMITEVLRAALDSVAAARAALDSITPVEQDP